MLLDLPGGRVAAFIDDDFEPAARDKATMVKIIDPDGSVSFGYASEFEKAFCPTGEGGGVDPTCSPGERPGGGAAAEARVREVAAQALARAVAGLKAEPPRPREERGRRGFRAAAVGAKPPEGKFKGGRAEEMPRGAAGKEGKVGPDERGDTPEQAALRTPGVKGVRRLGGGVSESHVMTLEDGTKVVWKPGNGEADFRGRAAGTQYLREAVAYDVAKIVGMDDMVPVTTVREHEGRKGSAQKFLEKAKQDGLKWGNKEFETDVKRSLFFDYVLGQTDRHDGNWLMDDGKVKLIDNGLILSTEPLPIRSYISNGLSFKEAIPDDIRRVWEGKWPAIEKALKKRGIERSAIRGAKERFDEITAPGKKWMDLKWGRGR